METNELMDRLAEGTISRREFKKILASFGVAMVTVPYGAAVRAATEDHPTIYTWEGWDSAGFHEAYIKKYGESPNFSLFGDEEEAFAKMRAGFKPDVTQPCSYKIPIWRDAKILQPIDTSRLEVWPDIIPSLKKIPGSFGEGKQWFAPADWGLTAILYRADLVELKEESWGLLWDERYRGRLSMSDSLIDGVMVAAIYAGAKDPYNMTPAEVAKTRELLRKQLPLLRYFWTSTTDIVQALASGELVATSAWNDAYTQLKRDGYDVKYMSPKEGAMTWVCGFCLMAGADPKKLDRAYDYLNAYLSPEGGAFGIMDTGYGHANIKAYDLVTEADLAERGLSRNPEALLSTGIFQEPIGNEPELQEMFEEVKAGI